MAKNPYTVLGVSENATDEDIRAAYRRLAKRYHPDLNPDDPAAASKMNDVNVAYDQIKTAEKREAYRNESRKQTYQQYSYGSDPWQNYHRTGQGYYGGSYTGGQNNDTNEPPFGWGSIFEESRQRRTNPYRFRSTRILFLILSFLMVTMFARCVVRGCLYSCVYPVFGSSSSETDTPSVSETVLRGE